MENSRLAYSRPASTYLHARWHALTITVLVAALAAMAAPRAEAQAPTRLPIRITSISLQNGQLVANGTFRGQPFTAPITLAATPSQRASCPILNLSLAPINLNLLGLVVTTSPICLDITAQQGGGLLGNLLCQVARLLNQGVSIPAILQAIGPVQTRTLLAALTTILDNVFSQITSVGPATVTQTAATATSCQVLHLALGPLDLNLLGLVVSLDNCANGPVVVDISAIRSTLPGGGLLGDLLCGLTGQTPLAILQQLVANL